jgi:hypothetical protein
MCSAGAKDCFSQEPNLGTALRALSFQRRDESEPLTIETEDVKLWSVAPLLAFS